MSWDPWIPLVTQGQPSLCSLILNVLVLVHGYTKISLLSPEIVLKLTDWPRDVSLKRSYFWPFFLFYRRVLSQSVLLLAERRGEFSAALPGSLTPGCLLSVRTSCISSALLCYCIIVTTPQLPIPLSSNPPTIDFLLCSQPWTVFVSSFLGIFQSTRAGAVQISAPECIFAQGRISC